MFFIQIAASLIMIKDYTENKSKLCEEKTGKSRINSTNGHLLNLEINNKYNKNKDL